MSNASGKLYFKGFSNSLSSEEIRNFFDAISPVRTIFTDRSTDEPWGYVEFKKPSDAIVVRQFGINGMIIRGQLVHVYLTEDFTQEADDAGDSVSQETFPTIDHGPEMPENLPIVAPVLVPGLDGPSTSNIPSPSLPGQFVNRPIDAPYDGPSTSRGPYHIDNNETNEGNTATGYSDGAHQASGETLYPFAVPIRGFRPQYMRRRNTARYFRRRNAFRAGNFMNQGGRVNRRRYMLRRSYPPRRYPSRFLSRVPSGEGEFAHSSLAQPITSARPELEPLPSQPSYLEHIPERVEEIIFSGDASSFSSSDMIYHLESTSLELSEYSSETSVESPTQKEASIEKTSEENVEPTEKTSEVDSEKTETVQSTEQITGEGQAVVELSPQTGEETAENTEVATENIPETEVEAEEKVEATCDEKEEGSSQTDAIEDPKEELRENEQVD